MTPADKKLVLDYRAAEGEKSCLSCCRKIGELYCTQINDRIETNMTCDKQLEVA